MESSCSNYMMHFEQVIILRPKNLYYCLAPQIMKILIRLIGLMTFPSCPSTGNKKAFSATRIYF